MTNSVITPEYTLTIEFPGILFAYSTDVDAFDVLHVELFTGVPGDRGDQGIKGDTGENGIGIQGVRGPPGIGLQGPPGPQGISGVGTIEWSGSSW